MNKEVLETQWVQAKDFLKEKWGNLTDEDIRQINGRYDQLIAKLQLRYGYSREQAEEEIRKWNFERGVKPTYASDKPFMRKEERVAKDEGSSLFKWLLAIAIPLLLLSLYFGMTKAPEPTSATPVVQEQVVTQTPADQTAAVSIRQALFANRALISDLQNFRISASDGVVTINGSVANAQERDSIGNFIQRINGVKQVNNQLEVRP